MTQFDGHRLAIHEDADLFREALNFTSTRTAFAEYMIEKDYFCSVMLKYLSDRLGSAMVFKGGTCLAKVYSEFHRLSEDLDFSISTPEASTRGQRQKLVEPVREAWGSITNSGLPFRTDKGLVGANEGRQYRGTARYKSAITGVEANIKVEVGLREPILEGPSLRNAKSVLLNPTSGRPMVGDVFVYCLSLREAVAEKFRAALSRRDVAIRDFYDIYTLVRRMGVDPRDSELIGLLTRKLAIPGNSPVDVSADRFQEVHRQLEPQLKPVLRPEDFTDFKLELAIKVIADLASALRK